MKFVSLLTAAPFSGKRVKPFEGERNYLSTGNLTSDSISFAKVTYDSKPSRADIIVSKGDVLFARMKDTTKVFLVDDKTDGIIVSTGFSVHRPIDEFYGPFLEFLFKTSFFLRQKNKFSTGAIQTAINNTGINKIKIPFLKKEEQVLIATLMNRIEALIVTRKKHLKQLDVFLKSTFFKMFGDPIKNEMKWEKKIFSDLLVDIQSGVSPKCEAREANEDEWGVLKLGAVTKCFFKENENKALPIGVEPRIKHEVKVGDLIFSRKNTYELVAACAYIFKTRQKLLMPDLIFRFVFNDESEINPIYIWKLLISDSQRRKIQSYAAGAAGSMPNISKTNLKKVMLPIPPLELQNKFASIVEKVEDIKSSYQENLSELKNLYGALSKKSFIGELDLSHASLAEDSTSKIHKVKLTDQITISDKVRSIVEYPMSVPEERTKLLRNLFDNYIFQSKESTLSLEKFWKHASFKTIDLMDEFDKPWGIDDYDQIKDWLFTLIQDGKLEQVFSEENKRIELKVKG